MTWVHPCPEKEAPQERQPCPPPGCPDRYKVTLPTVTSEVPDDLRCFCDRTREMMRAGWPYWDGDCLPALTHFTIPGDVYAFAARLREVFNQPLPRDPCTPTWLYPRNQMPSVPSDIPADLRRFLNRVRENLVRCPFSEDEAEPEQDCHSPVGEWVTSLMYPIEVTDELKASALVMRGRFYQGIHDRLAPSLVVPFAEIEIVYNDIYTDVGWDALVPTLLVSATMEDVRIYAELSETMTTTARLFGEVIPGIFATHPDEHITSSAVIVSGKLE